MKKFKSVSFLALSLVIFLVIPQWARAQQENEEIYFEKNTYGLNFGIKLFGNLAHLIGKSDVNEAIKGWNNLVVDSAQAFGFQKNGELKPLSLGQNFGGELTLSFIPHFTIGLGVGNLKFTKDSMVTITETGTEMKFARRPEVKAIPLTLSLYYSLPLGETFKIVVGAGVGYYLGKFRNEIEETFDDESILLWFEANSNTIGFQGSLDLELNISRSMAFVFGVSGRCAKLKDLVGSFNVAYPEPDNEYDFSRADQTLWYVEEDFEVGWYAGLNYDDEKPEWSFYRNVRKAEISLSSIALQIGIVIRLSQLFKR